MKGTMTMTDSFKKGDTVYFGRPNGEKTLGEILKVNARSYMIGQLEARGTTRIRTNGKWRVAKSLVTAAEGTVPTPAPKRTDAEIIFDLREVESRLSPERLFWDGERNRADARREERTLRAEEKRLLHELGRLPTRDEMWS